MAKREYSFDPIALVSLSQRYGSQGRLPTTPMEALQQAGPDEPLTSKDEQVELQEIVLNALNHLEDWEQWLLNALLFEKMSLRQVEFVLGMPKTTVARKRDIVLGKLKTYLANEPVIRRYLHGE
jgi:DNA-directed RNA polymerase specialized sigma subunit